MRRWIGPSLGVIWMLFLARAWGPLPALGPLLDLHRGVWQHHEVVWRDQSLPGLKAPVQVAIDQNGVPHFFAQNSTDLYLAQGFITAQNRLFQMDVTTRSMSGHLGELVGEKGRAMDRFFVRFGMREAEETLHQEVMSDPETAPMVQSYIAGANTAIERLQELPVEYKFLGQTPQPMDTHTVTRMAKTMTYALSGGSPDYLLSHLQQTLTSAQILDLFPEFLPSAYEDFVFPARKAQSRAPETPEMFTFHTHLKNFPDIPRPNPANGSNNWVVGPKKSLTGHSILANDNHLDLSLPNVWFENQLSCPEFNVYGVSFPSVPGIVNGFNAWTAWGPTNGSTDALDYYEIEFENENSLKYRDGDEWREGKIVDERIRGETIRVTWSRWGPVLHREGRYGLVANWTGRRVSNELKAIRHLYTAHSAQECLKAFRDWQVPIQNFVCADQDHFGLIHAGFIAERAVGEGRFVEPPTKLALQKGIPENSRPMAYDPPEGFLRSANERIVGPEFPYYMGWNYEEPFRAMRIRRMLEAKEKFSGEDFIAMQADDFDTEAQMILPILLKTLRRDGLTGAQHKILSLLDQWNFRAQADHIEASVYKQWYRELKQKVFSDKLKLTERPRFMPHDARIAWMLQRVLNNSKDADAKWLDDPKTPEIETLADVSTRAFQAAWKTLTATYGTEPSSWEWRRWIKTKIPHLAKIPGFGTELLSMNGAADSIDGNNGSHAAVYRFVIELGDSPKAWMQVPGGISGDPFSKQFERGVQEWSRGEMHAVEFYRDIDDARAHAKQVIELKPEGA